MFNLSEACCQTNETSGEQHALSFSFKMSRNELTNRGTYALSAHQDKYVTENQIVGDLNTSLHIVKIPTISSPVGIHSLLQHTIVSQMFVIN
jgi:hypothetical protein